MKVTIELTDYSKPPKPKIKVHSAWGDSKMIDLEVDGQLYRLSADELISAVKRAKLNFLEE